AIAIGDTVTNETINGTNAAGAGKIESPGVHDIYAFTATAGQQVYFDFLGVNSGLDVKWRLVDEVGTVLFDRNLNGDAGVYPLTRGGAYTIDVGYNLNNSTGTYGFKLWDVQPPDQFHMAIGD